MCKQSKRLEKDVHLEEVSKRVYRIKPKKKPLRVDLGLPKKKVLEEYVRNGYHIEPEYDSESLSGHVVRYWAVKPR